MFQGSRGETLAPSYNTQRPLNPAKPMTAFPL